MSSKKALVAFDFDHTIIDDNSDLYVGRLAPGGKLPDEIKSLYSPDGWTEYMAAIFTYLHKTGVSSEQIISCMHEIPLVKGMRDLLKYLGNCKSISYDVIIISDSNSIFINTIMENLGLSDIVEKVYTNPACWDSDGRLTIDVYHKQDWCKLSTHNLCKGHILDEHIAEQAKNGKLYDLVAFVGDGSNDLCPSLRLRKEDLIFPRIGYRLVKIIKDHPAIAGVEEWETGLDIMNALQNQLDQVHEKQ